MKILSNMVITLALFAVGSIALFYFAQSALLYPAPTRSFPDTLPAKVEKISLKESYALLLESPQALDGSPRPLVIFAHGNGEAAYMWVNEFGELLTRGISVLLVEYPGYAGAAGRPSRNSIESAMLESYDLMVQRPAVDRSRIVAYGRSIGSGAASLLAAERKVAALCLESGFSSLASLVREKRLPWFLLRDRYDNQSIVRELDVPVFLYHGDRDEIIPVEHSQRLASVGKDVTLVEARCGHNDCPRPWPALLEFLEQKLGFGRP